MRGTFYIGIKYNMSVFVFRRIKVQIQKVKLTECKTGDILAEAPTNIHGAIIVLEDTVLNEYIINKLIQTGIKSVKIYVCSKKGKSGKSNDVYLNIKKTIGREYYP